LDSKFTCSQICGKKIQLKSRKGWWDSKVRLSSHTLWVDGEKPEHLKNILSLFELVSRTVLRRLILQGSSFKRLLHSDVFVIDSAQPSIDEIFWFGEN